ncbi:MAG: alpha/beta hydrolase [Actinomycetota bacterium]
MTDAGHRLAARDHGGNGPGVVLIHGLASNLAVWDLVAPHLVGAGFRVVAYDQRHHGLSSDADHDFGSEALVSDLRAVIEAFDLRTPIVVGHSWGASVALHHAAADHDCPGVVCVDGAIFDMQALGRKWEDVEERMRPPRLIGPEDEIFTRIREYSHVIPWERLEPVEHRSFLHLPDGTVRPRLDMNDHMTIAHTLWAERVWDLYERIACPAMLVLARGPGSDDGFTSMKQMCVERVRERKADVHIEWLESVHDIPLLHPEVLAELITGAANAR